MINTTTRTPAEVEVRHFDDAPEGATCNVCKRRIAADEGTRFFFTVGAAASVAVSVWTHSHLVADCEADQWADITDHKTMRAVAAERGLI